VNRFASLCLVGVLGCASTSPASAFHDVAQHVEQRSGQRLRWDEAMPAKTEVDRTLRDLLAKDLSVDGAVEVALLRNRSLVAIYEELSVGQADLVQAGLLRNPALSVGVPPAEIEAISPPIVVGIAEDFLGLLMLSARKTIARAHLEAVEMRVASEVLDHAARVRTAYFTLQGAEQVAAMHRIVADAADAAAALAGAQRDAGNLSDLGFETQRGLAEQARIERERGEADVLRAREQLTRLMGVWGFEAGYTVTSRLPELPASEPPLEHLESLAIGQRSDLAAMRTEVEELGHVSSLARSTRWTGSLTVGLEAARLVDGNYSFGPNASIELPLFDQRQALVARLDALLRQSEARLQARAVDARSEVRAARDAMVAARLVAERYRTVIVPLREHIVALAQQHYDAMLMSPYELLLAKQSEVTAYRDYIDTVRDYWIARSDLERAVGGRLAPWPHGGVQ
jgi:cobalt-zinc-cadmium efflux system outer membrane protein